MQSYEIATEGVCPKKIAFSLEGGKLHNIKFYGGCPGNTAAIAKLLEGADALRTVQVLKGNRCANRPSSCADQLAKGVETALQKANG